MLNEQRRAQLRQIGFIDQEMDAIDERMRTATDAEKNRLVAWEMARDTLQDDALDDDTKDLLANELSNNN